MFYLFSANMKGWLCTLEASLEMDIFVIVFFSAEHCFSVCNKYKVSVHMFDVLLYV